MAIDTEAIKVHVRGILEALGDDPDREGLKETPDRVARMYEEVFEGMNYTNHEIAQMFNKTFTDRMEFGSASRDMVIVRDIDIFSYCEHHLALMYDMKVTVAYIPKEKIWWQNAFSCRNVLVRILQILCRRSWKVKMWRL